MSHEKRPTPEFKREAVRLALTSGRTRREIADDLGVVRTIDLPFMFAQDPALGSDHEAVWVEPQADRAVREGRRHAVPVRSKLMRHVGDTSLLCSTKPSKNWWQRHQLGLFRGPDAGNASEQITVRRLLPELQAPLLQPFV